LTNFRVIIRQSCKQLFSFSRLLTIQS